MSTYLIFNQLQIIHPQFRPKSRSSVLEPSQNFLSNTTGRVSRCLKPTVWTVEQSVSGVLYISSLLRSPKLPKRKGISTIERPIIEGRTDHRENKFLQEIK
ncbi:neurotrimin-like isoform X2 [Vespula maculifrons]|uniref:Neurotrimin-like isoform X2 n=1 Tax=Vespula maculifrons TaxID=7453 RepID=A0ABD2BI17_VESMC